MMAAGGFVGGLGSLAGAALGSVVPGEVMGVIVQEPCISWKRRIRRALSYDEAWQNGGRKQ